MSIATSVWFSAILAQALKGGARKGPQKIFNRSSNPQSERKVMARTELPEEARLLTPGEVAKLFRVDPKTVTRWAKAGMLSVIRTPGGHRRYKEAEIRKLLEPVQPETV